MYRFFVEESQIYDGTVHITGSDVNHIKNVLRLLRAVAHTVDHRIFKGNAPSGFRKIIAAGR